MITTTKFIVVRVLDQILGKHGSANLDGNCKSPFRVLKRDGLLLLSEATLSAAGGKG